MKTDLEELKDSDLRIPEAETNGDREFFDKLLAPAFAFRRANGEIIDRPSFISRVSRSSQRHSDLLAIDVLSHDRAIVSSLVKIADRRDGNTHDWLHSVRFYVRTEGRDDWMLLAWANEGVLPPEQHVELADHLSGRDRNQDLELWKHHASTGGDDKSRMVTLASWLLGFAAAILAYLATQFLFSEIVARDEWLQAVVVAAVGAVISLAGAYIAVLYGGYANRNWRIADVIAWRHGWLDLLPEVDRTSAESNRPSGASRLLSTSWRHLRHPLISLDDYAWRLARPVRPDRLAPVFEVFCIFSLLAFSAHVLVGLYSLGRF